MQEQFSAPHKPSEAFSQQSYDAYVSSNHAVGKNYTAQHREREQARDNLLDSEEAAYAAKPWMDVAVDLYEAKNAAAHDVRGDGETIYDIDEQNALNDLTHYAEKRARQAADGIRGDELSQPETEMLDVFKAEAEMRQAQAGFNLESLSQEQIDQAYRIAEQRAKDARQRGDRAEALKYDNIARRANEFYELYSGEQLDEDVRHAMQQKLLPDAENAGLVLSALNEDGGHSSDDTRRRAGHAKLDARNMRETTEVYKLFAEIQGVASEVPRQVLDVADSPVEAKELLYSQSELLEGLYSEANAYNDYLIAHRSELSNATKQFDIGLQLFKQHRDSFRMVMESWKANSSERMSFQEYVNAIVYEDGGASDELQDAASNTNLLMRNKSWSDREMQAVRRMVRRNTDKSDMTPMGRKFTREYFGV